MRLWHVRCWPDSTSSGDPVVAFQTVTSLLVVLQLASLSSFEPDQLNARMVC
jgi:hypothetical protein